MSHFADLSSDAGSSESGRSRSASPSSLLKPTANFCCPALVRLAPKPYARPQAKLRLVPAPARCAKAALTVLSRGTSTAKFSAWASCKACRKYVSNQLFSCPATSSDQSLTYRRRRDVSGSCVMTVLLCYSYYAGKDACVNCASIMLNA